MKKKRIIYGVRGMMEYQALLRIGKASLRVTFTDGSATAMGSVPATFATANPVVQMAIEHSREYQSGLISKLKEIDCGEEVEVGKAPAPLTSGEVEPLPVVQGVSGEVEAKQPAPTGCKFPPLGDLPLPPDVEQVEVSDLDTAKQYLIDRFGLAPSALRYKKAIDDAAAKHNIAFVYPQ